jgi:hypothetical protein
MASQTELNRTLDRLDALARQAADADSAYPRDGVAVAFGFADTAEFSVALQAGPSDPDLDFMAADFEECLLALGYCGQFHGLRGLAPR